MDEPYHINSYKEESKYNAILLAFYWYGLFEFIFHYVVFKSNNDSNAIKAKYV